MAGVDHADHGWTHTYDLVAGESAITVLTHGGHLIAASWPDVEGRRVNAVRRLAALEDYQSWATNKCVGALIGRVAGRISGARFALDGRTHHLAANEGPNQLHGGPGGFHTVEWQAEAGTDGDDAVVVLRHHSPDGDQGFPGAVDAVATYRLSPGRLVLGLEATTTATTPVSLTSHPYWNLDGSDELAGHRLTVAASRVLEVDDALLPTGGILGVEDTPMDLRGARVVDDDTPHFDDCYLLDARAAASLVGTSGRRMRVTTDRPALQVYLAPNAQGHHGHACLEAQAPPDAVNHPAFGDVLLRPGQTFRATIDHRFDAIAPPPTPARWS